MFCNSKLHFLALFSKSGCWVKGIYATKPEKVATYSISLTTPFKAFSQGGKEYILNNANEIYELNQNAKAVPLDKTKKTGKRNVIIV